MQKRIIWCLVALNILAVAIYGANRFLIHQKRAAAQKAGDTATATAEEAAGITSKQDYLQRLQIYDTSQKTGNIADNELNWCLGLMNKGPIKNHKGAKAELNVEIVATLVYVKRFTPSQKEKIYQATLPMFTNTDETGDGLEKIYACRMMKKMKDKRAVPYLLPLLNDPRPDICLMAQRTLTSLGYKAPS